MNNLCSNDVIVVSIAISVLFLPCSCGLESNYLFYSRLPATLLLPTSCQYNNTFQPAFTVAVLPFHLSNDCWQHLSHVKPVESHGSLHQLLAVKRQRLFSILRTGSKQHFSRSIAHSSQGSKSLYLCCILRLFKK